MMKHEPVIKFEDICSQDNYCRLARNITQKIYKNRSSGKIDYLTGKKMIQTIVKKCRLYYTGDINPVQLLSTVSEIERIRCECHIQYTYHRC